MSFAQKLIAFRRERGFTQVSLAEKVGVHQSQITRYETGAALPTFEVLRGIAVALSVSADALLFEDGERAPANEFKHYLKALDRLDADEKRTAKELLDALLLKHDAKRWTERKAS